MAWPPQARRLLPVTLRSLLIVRTIAPGVITNAGHDALGWACAAGCAAMVADMIDGNGQAAKDGVGGGQA